MVKLTFPPFPQSLKNSRSFRDVADADYIAARLSYRAQLPVQFLWVSQQTFEKYLKFILFLERIKGRSWVTIWHPPSRAIEDAGLVHDLTKSTQTFVKDVDRTGASGTWRCPSSCGGIGSSRSTVPCGSCGVSAPASRARAVSKEHDTVMVFIHGTLSCGLQSLKDLLPGALPTLPVYRYKHDTLLRVSANGQELDS